MPTMVAQGGIRGIADILAARRKVDMADVIFLLDPNENPFTLISSKVSKKVAINSKFSWLEDEICPEWDAVNNGAGYTAGDTGVVVDNIAYFKAGQVVQVVQSSVPTELMLVTAGDETTANHAGAYITVTRSVGLTAAVALVDDDALHIIGTSMEEGAALPAALSTQTIERINYCQIFREPIILTRTEMDSDLYGGKDQNYQRNKKGKEFARQIENSFWWGEPREWSGAGGKKQWLNGGIYYWINTLASANITTQAELTEAEFEGFLRTGFRYGSGEKWLFAAPLICEAISYWMKGRLQAKSSDKLGGIAITTWYSAHGTIHIVPTKMLENPAVGTGFGGCAFLVDMEDVTYRYLQNEDVELQIDVKRDGADSQSDAYRGAIGLEIHLAKHHSVLKGVATYAS